MSEPVSNDLGALEAPDAAATSEERRAGGRRLAERVDEFMQQGKPLQARSLLARNWQDAAPDLPLRYPVVLEAISARFAAQLARYVRMGGQAPELTVELSGKQVIRGHIASAGRRLGDLPRDQAEYLASLGADAAVYTAKLLSIRLSASGDPDTVEVELVRPELRRCSSCGRLHDEVEQVNCADCRAKRRRKDPERAEPEGAPLALQEAIDALTTGDEPTSD
jgi:hypothetical protein